jgi:hypothetical protein
LFPIDENFIRNVNQKTKGMVFYLDKYYDLKTKNWFAIQTDNLPIVYENRLAPDLSTITDLDVRAFTKQFLNILNEKELRIAFRALSRALAGHFEDKKWYSFLGLRNSGKGVLQEIIKWAFGSYCCSFNVPMLKSCHKGDASDMRWIITSKLHLKRIAFSIY